MEDEVGEPDPVALGRELGDARIARSESLKTTASAAGLSATYLQKLERGAVETPSPRILRALSRHLDLSYRRLMELAGYEVPTARDEKGSLGRALAAVRLSQSEERAVAAFVSHLVSQRPQKS